LYSSRFVAINSRLNHLLELCRYTDCRSDATSLSRLPIF
jgi:hypothetical protein